MTSGQTLHVQIVMAALVVVLAFFFMPASESAEMPIMRVSVFRLHLSKLTHCVRVASLIQASSVS